jgi:hypothetical protein
MLNRGERPSAGGRRGAPHWPGVCPWNESPHPSINTSPLLATQHLSHACLPYLPSDSAVTRLEAGGLRLESPHVLLVELARKDNVAPTQLTLESAIRRAQLMVTRNLEQVQRQGSARRRECSKQGGGGRGGGRGVVACRGVRAVMTIITTR